MFLNLRKLFHFKNASLTSKMIAFVIIMITFSAVIAGYGLFEINNLSNKIHTVHDTYWPEANEIKNIKLTINSQITDLRSYELGQTTTKTQFTSKIQIINSLLNNISKIVGSSNNDLSSISYNYKEIITLASGKDTGIFDLTDSYYTTQNQRVQGYQNFKNVHHLINNLLENLKYQSSTETGHNNNTISKMVLELNNFLWKGEGLISNAMVETNNSKINLLKSEFLTLYNGSSNSNSIINSLSRFSTSIPLAVADNSSGSLSNVYFNEVQDLIVNGNNTYSSWNNFVTSNDSGLLNYKISENNFISQRNSLLNRIDSYVINLDSSLSQFEHSANTKMNSIAASTELSIITTGLLSTILSLVALVIGLLYARSIVNPIKNISKISNKFSKGDLTQVIEDTDRSDELGILLRTFRDMSNYLSDIIKQVSTLSKSLASSAEEMASSSEEVNASSQEISNMTQQMSKGAQEQTKKIVETLNYSSQLQEKFEEKVKDINSTTSLIESISGQVNMLALNASIEAARAGEYGRGFAVVADNIRRLAEDTNDSVEKVQLTINGLRTSLTGSIVNIIESVQKIASVAEQTSAGTEETSAATEEQTAVMEELTASAQELANIASQLDQIISNFIL